MKEKMIKAFMPLFLLSAISLLLVFGFYIIIDIITPPKIVDLGVTIIAGYTVPNMLLYIGAFSIFLSWIIHGFGFIIVRR